MNELYTLKRYVKKYFPHIVLGLAFVIATNLLSIVSPEIIRNAIDNIKVFPIKEILFNSAFLIVIFTLIQGLFRYLMRRVLISTSRYIEVDIRNDLFRKIQTLSASYFNKTRTGDIMARFNNDLNSVRMVLGPGIMYLANTIAITPIVIIKMIDYDAVLTGYVLIPLIFIPFWVDIFEKQFYKKFKAVQDHYSIIEAKVQENLSGARVVKAYCQEQNEIEQFKILNQEFVRKNYSLALYQGWFFPMFGFILGIGTLIILWKGGGRVINNQLTIGELIAFNMLLGLMIWPMMGLGWVVNLFQRGAASMTRINEIFNVEPEIKDSVDVKSIEGLEGKIKITDLVFSYDTASPVLKNINLTIEPGKTLGIVGETGSGKSTLVNLISRIYKVDNDKIFIDDVDINKIPLGQLRKAIGYVTQETFLFSESVEKNITFGVDDYKPEEVEKASYISHLHSDVQYFPQTYNSIIGERGVMLSGGQKQRTSIARALIKKPKILILDDAFSSVDTHTEDRILTNLKKHIKNITCIIISHRISTLKDADEIIVLDEGKIVEKGTHQDLLKLNGIYADIYYKQLLMEEIESEK